MIAVLVVANIALAATIWLKKEDTEKKVMPMGTPRGDARDYLVSSLSMNEQQVQSFDSLRRGHFERMRTYKDQMRRLKDSLFEGLRKQQQAQATSIAERIGQVQAQIDIETFNHFAQLRLLLNDEQKQTFDQTIQEVLRTMAPKGPPHDRPIRDGDRMGPPPGEGPPPDALLH